jgi:hypothetical protein
MCQAHGTEIYLQKFVLGQQEKIPRLLSVYVSRFFTVFTRQPVIIIIIIIIIVVVRI